MIRLWRGKDEKNEQQVERNTKSAESLFLPEKGSVQAVSIVEKLRQTKGPNEYTVRTSASIEKKTPPRS